MIRLIEGDQFNANKFENTRPQIRPNYISLCDPSYFLNVLNKLPRTFEIRTNNGSCYFNIDIIKDLSPNIYEFLQRSEESDVFKLPIENNNVLKKFEDICQGKLVFFKQEDLDQCRFITCTLQIQNVPDYMTMDITMDMRTRKRMLKKGVTISPDCLNYLLERIQKTFTITTNSSEYECNFYGIFSSEVIQKFVTDNPDSRKYTYDYDDEYGEFQQICNLFNFNEVSITTANLDLLKQIAEDLQINLILERINCIQNKQEKMIEKVEEEQDSIDMINELFEWLHQINKLSVQTVKNSIIKSVWSKTEENVQELAAFILQVISSEYLLHQSILELLLQLDSEDSKELKVLFPFIKEKLLICFDKKKNNCAFVYRLYQKELVSKDELFQNLKTKHISDNLYSWFLPELIEFNLIDKYDFTNKKPSSVSSIIQTYWPDKIDLYKKMRDSFEPDDEIARSLRIDDVDTFQKIISNNQIKDISKCFIPSNIFDSFYNRQVSYLNYSAAFGSIKCFKYLILNHLKVDSSTFYYAIYGGNIEIIKIVDNQLPQQMRNISHYSYNKHYQMGNEMDVYRILNDLIEKHRYDLFDWFFEQKITKYEVIHQNLDNIIINSVSNGNVQALVSFIDKGFNIFDFQERKNLQSLAAENGFYQLLKFLYNVNDKETQETFHWGSKNSSYVSFGNLNIFKFLLETKKDRWQYTSALKDAIENDCMKMINYFFDNYSN